MTNPNQDGFTSEAAFFTGVVEDVHDPKEMGRVRVRCFGYHSPNKTDIPTSSLPWALVMMPITSASISGIGKSATGIQQGSWVIGFFRDGRSAQLPLVLGTIPSMTMGGDKNKGFSDPAGIHPITPGAIDNPLESRSVYESSGAYVARTDLGQTDIEQAVPPKLESVSVPEPDAYYSRKTWSTPRIKDRVKPAYPSNSAERTVSGHVLEVDDTPGQTRLLRQHRSGTFEEIYDNGDRSLTVVGDRYTVILGADNIYIKGTVSLTIDGDFRQLVKGNYHLEVEGNKTEYVKGSRQSKIGNSEQIEILQERAVNITGNEKLRIGEDRTTIIDGEDTLSIGRDSSTVIGGDMAVAISGTSSIYSSDNSAFSSGGAMTVSSSNNLKIETLANIAVNSDGSYSSTIGSGQSISVTGSSSLNVSGSNILSAGGSQTISSGSSIGISASNSVSVTSSSNSASPPWS